MLRDWLGPDDLEEFWQRQFGAAPCARPGSARAALAVCNWQSLDGMLRAQPAPDLLVTRRGREVSAPAPRSLAELQTLFAEDTGIVVRHAERHDPALAAYCAALAHDIPGEQRVLVFATPSGAHGFGWHYDAEEVFIVQTEGQKDYYFRCNTLDPEPARGAQPDFSRIREERTPLMSCSLLAGDWLYLPRGYWHVAQPRQASLSISIGIFPAERARMYANATLDTLGP
jgi:ribosomal protein L16 Arg81 hydroxylase